MYKKILVLGHRALFVVSLVTAFLIIASISHDPVAHAQRRAGKVMDVEPLGGPAVVDAGSITGKVFQDYNGNGLYDTTAGLNSIDAGVANVTVSAYDASGANVGFTVTDAAGNYSLSASGTGPYRVEFTNIPSGSAPSARSRDSVSGAAATDSGSTVQFVPNGAVSNVNLALNRPEEYCQNNPSIVAARMVEGAQNGNFATAPLLQDFPYNSGTTYTDPTSANYDSPSTHTF